MKENNPAIADKQYHICLNGNSAEGYVDAYPVGREDLQKQLDELLDQNVFQDDSEIEIYELSTLKVETTKSVKIIEN